MNLWDLEEVILINIFLFHKNIPKDAKQYNKLLNDETQCYYDYEFTNNDKRDVVNTIKTKYKQLKLRTYDAIFDKTKYDMHGESHWR